MLLKWGIGGAIVVAIYALISGSMGILEGSLIGFGLGIFLRKWIFRNLWM